MLPWAAFPGKYPAPLDYHQLKRETYHVAFPGLEVLLPPVDLSQVFLLGNALEQSQRVPLDLLAGLLPLQLPSDHYQDLLEEEDLVLNTQAESLEVEGDL